MKILKSLYLLCAKSGSEAIIRDYVRNYISNNNISVEVIEDEAGNLLIRKGHSPSGLYPCFAAHMDEVHSPVQKVIVNTVENGQQLLYATDKDGNRTGCGADDKNGIWILLKLLKEQKYLKVAMFAGEEKIKEYNAAGELINSTAGCRGARAVDLDWFGDVAYIIECDRKGSHDIVWHSRCKQKGTTTTTEIPLCIEDFPKWLESQGFGFKRCTGGKTDVTELRIRGLKKEMCNISVGYYNAHKAEEYTNFEELNNTYKFICSALQKKE